MILEDAIDTVSEKFLYEPDITLLRDAWFVMQPKANGFYYGDCEDFALTVFWLMSNKSIVTFIWHLVFTGRYELHFVKSNGAESINHCVASIADLWFDNHTLSAMSKFDFFTKTNHVYGKRINRIVILSKLIIGLFQK